MTDSPTPPEGWADLADDERTPGDPLPPYPFRQADGTIVVRFFVSEQSDDGWAYGSGEDVLSPGDDGYDEADALLTSWGV